MKKRGFIDMIAKTEIEGKKGYYHLDEDITIQGFFIPRGFIWDLASKPPWIRWAGYRADDVRTEKASLIHDILFYTHKVSFSKANAIYRKQAIADGYPTRKAWVEWAAITAFGKSHWDNDAEDRKLWNSILANWATRPDWDIIRVLFPVIIY